MAFRSTRTAVRTSKPAQHQQQHQQQHMSRNFVSGGSIRPNNPPVVSYPPPAAQVNKTYPPPAAQVNKTYPPPAAQVNQTQPTPAPTPAAPKLEMKDREGDVIMDSSEAAPNVDMDPEQLKAERRRLFEGLKKVTGVRKKPSKQMMQRRLRRHLAPKNATMALQEVCPGASFKISLMPDVTPPFFMAEVEVGGKKYQGTGSSKAVARAAAAERALQSFVRMQTKTKDSEGNEIGEDEDTTPWSVLAGFALHKLFCDWREGRVGVPTYVEAFGPPLTGEAASCQNETPAPNKPKAFTTPEKKKAKSAKQLPTNAATRHPVMLLHEMRPEVVFEMTEHVPGRDGQTPSVTIVAKVDGQTFQGKARTKKEAKKEAGKAAMIALFGVQYPAESV